MSHIFKIKNVLLTIHPISLGLEIHYFENFFIKLNLTNTKRPVGLLYIHIYYPRVNFLLAYSVGHILLFLLWVE